MQIALVSARSLGSDQGIDFQPWRKESIGLVVLVARLETAEDCRQRLKPEDKRALCGTTES